jgi:hypothetical protein
MGYGRDRGDEQQRRKVSNQRETHGGQLEADSEDGLGGNFGSDSRIRQRSRPGGVDEWEQRPTGNDRANPEMKIK